MKRFNKVLGFVSGFLIMVISLLAAFETVARSIFNHPTFWSLPISQYLLLCVAFLGGSYTLQTDGHVNVELFIERFRRRSKRVLIVLGYLLSVVYICVLLYYTVQVAILSGRFGWDVVTAFPIPAVILYGIMIFGFVTLLVTFYYKLFKWR